MKIAIIKIKNFPFTFHIMLAGIILSVAFYMYCINEAVRSGVALNNAQAKISSIESSLSDLESRYVESMSSITLDSAKNIGLSEPLSKIFISKGISIGSLTYAGEVKSLK